MSDFGTSSCSRDVLPSHVDSSEREILAAAYFERAQHYLVREEWQEAVLCLREAIRHDSDQRYHRLLAQTLRWIPTVEVRRSRRRHGPSHVPRR